MSMTKRRIVLGVAGCLFALMVGGSVSAAGTGHGTVDVNDVTLDPHGGLVQGSDGGERNINAYLPGAFNGATDKINTQATFLYEEAVEYNPNVGGVIRVNYYDETGSHPFG